MYRYVDSKQKSTQSIVVNHKIATCFSDKKLLRKLTNHPVHILDKNNKISPSSFIPYCSFGRDAKMGTEVDGFEIPVCNSFEPKIHYDQLCYEVDLNKYKVKDSFMLQVMSGFNLILDYNEERQTETPKDRNQETKGAGAHIYIETLSMCQYSILE